MKWIHCIIRTGIRIGRSLLLVRISSRRVWGLHMEVSNKNEWERSKISIKIRIPNYKTGLTSNPKRHQSRHTELSKTKMSKLRANLRFSAGSYTDQWKAQWLCLADIQPTITMTPWNINLKRTSANSNARNMRQENRFHDNRKWWKHKTTLLASLISKDFCTHL